MWFCTFAPQLYCNNLDENFKKIINECYGERYSSLRHKFCNLLVFSPKLQRPGW